MRMHRYRQPPLMIRYFIILGFVQIFQPNSFYMFISCLFNFTQRIVRIRYRIVRMRIVRMETAPSTDYVL